MVFGLGGTDDEMDLSGTNARALRPQKGPRVSGEAGESARRPDRPMIELNFGILVCPPETERAFASRRYVRPSGP